MSQELKPVLEIHELVRIIKDKIIVDGISFTVHEGEIFGLLGSNGSGKTTTFNMLAGLVKPTSGKIKIFGHVPGRHYDPRRDIGFVTQDDSVYITLSVKENLQFFASLYGIKDQESKKRIEKLLNQLTLKDKENEMAADLSGGMRKRLNIACSLIHDPKIILLDEPTVGLDPAVRKEVWMAIKELHKSKKTIIITSHYMDEVEQLCGKVAIMFHGRIAAHGTPDELKTRYGLKQMEDVFAHLIKKED